MNTSNQSNNITQNKQNIKTYHKTNLNSITITITSNSSHVANNT